MNFTSTCYYPELKGIKKAANLLKGVAMVTPLQFNERLSNEFGAEIWCKREDLQVVRSYKIRGAYNKILHLNEQKKCRTVVCASAGNHAQGVAYACNKLSVSAKIFMPETTPKQKIAQVKMFGSNHVEILLKGDTFDDALQFALNHAKTNDLDFIHPFDDERIIEGQGTVGLEILNEIPHHLDYLILPVGGGGLAAGVSSVFRTLSPKTKIIGVEPTGAASMSRALEENQAVYLNHIDKFVDGAAVKQVGKLNFNICKTNLDKMICVDEGLICKTMLKMYEEHAIVLEPAGALSIAALNTIKDKIQGKSVCCILSGGNNDISRTEEIREKALLYERLKHYFVINFPQRAGALRTFLNEVLGPTDDIVFFQYIKKNIKAMAPAIVGIELEKVDDFEPLMSRLKTTTYLDRYLNEQEDLFSFLI